MQICQRGRRGHRLRLSPACLREAQGSRLWIVQQAQGAQPSEIIGIRTARGGDAGDGGHLGLTLRQDLNVDHKDHRKKDVYLLTVRSFLVGISGVSILY
jgi:hypothetical protein